MELARRDFEILIQLKHQTQASQQNEFIRNSNFGPYAGNFGVMDCG